MTETITAGQRPASGTWTPKLPGRRPPTRRTRRRREQVAGYLFISPQLLGFAVFVLGPLIAVFVYSLQHRGLLAGDVTFAGLENYRRMVAEDPAFRRTMLNTAVFTAGLVPINVGLGLGTALLLSGRRFGNGFFQALFFAPVVTSAAAWAITWRFILQGNLGPLNQMLAVIGIAGPNWLREPAWAMAAVIVTRALKTVGLKMIIFLAAIRTIPQEHVEAARMDGAGSWQLFRHVLLPHLAPAIFLVVVITMIGSMQVFDHIILMTNGGPGNATMVLVFYIYHQAFQAFDAGYASGLAVILFVVTLLLTLAQWWLRRKAGDED